MRCFLLAVIVVFMVFTCHGVVGFKKFEKGALAYLLFKGLQPKPHASEMMVMMPAGMDLNEVKVPMMMMVMPVTATSTTPSMMAENMMPSDMMPSMASNSGSMMMMKPNQMMMKPNQMMMAQMMQQMMGGDAGDGKESNSKNEMGSGGMANPMNTMMMAGNGSGGSNGSGPPAMMNPDSTDIPQEDNSKNVIEALARYEAVHHGREHVHLPVGPVQSTEAAQPHLHHHHHAHHHRV